MAIHQVAHAKLPKEDFDKEIESHGLKISLRRGTRCPCVAEESRQPDPTCNVCDGWGTIWDTGVQATAFGPNRRINRMYEEPGSIDTADAYFTFPSGTFIGHLDRIVVSDEIIIYSEFFTKGAVNQLTGASREKSRFQNILLVERAIWSARTPSSGFPYTYQLNDLIENVDFTIENGNEILWHSNAVPNGARYVIRFQTNSEYLVWAPRGRLEGSVHFPGQYLCKRIDFIKAPQ
jgi:hypothetical protein